MKDRIFDLLKYPSVRVAAICFLIAVLLLIIRRQRDEVSPPSKQQALKLPVMGGGEKDLKESPVTELMKHFTPWRSATTPQSASEKKPAPVVESKPVPAEALPKLIHDYEVVQKSVAEEEVVKPVEKSIPFGSVVACRLLQPVKCGKTAVPVIAEVLQPVRDGRGRAWISQGTRVHGSLHSGSLTGRLESTGGWTFVLPGHKLYDVKASLQDRDFNPNLRIYGVNDGTAGIAGTVMKASDWKSRTVSGGFAIAADATQDRARTALGEVELGSARNALLRGVSALAKSVVPKAESATDPIVSAPAGKEFYLYIEDRGGRDAIHGSEEVEAMLRERSRLMEQLRQQTGKERP